MDAHPGTPLETADDTPTDSQRLAESDAVLDQEAQRHLRDGLESDDALGELLRHAGADGLRKIDEIDRQRAQLRDLNRLRRELRVSRSEVARRMRTSPAAVARIEAGEVDVRLSTLGRYAQAIGCYLTWAFKPILPR